MGQRIKEMWSSDVWLRILSVISVCMLIAGLIIPPLGVIDGSVLIAVSEIAFLGVLFQVSKAIDKGHSIKASRGDTSIEVTKSNDEFRG